MTNSTRSITLPINDFYSRIGRRSLPLFLLLLFFSAVPDLLAQTPVTAPEVGVIEDTITFPPTSLNQEMTYEFNDNVVNLGDEDLIIRQVIFTGEASDEFALSDSVKLPIVVRPLDSLVLSLTFAPQVPDLRTARIVMFTNIPVDSTITLELNGVGATPVLEYPDSVIFPVTQVGEFRDTVVRGILRNASLVRVVVDSVSLHSDYFSVVAPPAFPLVLDTGASLDLTLRFAPASAGIALDTLRIESSGQPNRVEIKLTGMGEGDTSSSIASIVRSNELRLRSVTQPLRGEGRFVVTPGSSGNATLDLVNLAGVSIRTFEVMGRDGEEVNVFWDGTDRNGAALLDGEYLLRLRTGEEQMVLPLIYLAE